MKNINTLLLHQFLQKPHVLIESCDIFRILVMEDLSLLRDEDDILAPGGADLSDRVVEPATEEVARDGSPGMLPREYHSEAVVSDFVREHIRYESVRKKRLTEP